MPTYDYRCEQCGNRFERIQKFSDSPLTSCPKCKGSVKRIVPATGIVFKGSGFYINDSRKASGKAADGESSSKADSAPKADSAAKSSLPKPAAVSDN